MGNVRRFVKVPFAHGGGGGASGAARTGGGRIQKGARMSELLSQRGLGKLDAAPRDKMGSLRSEVNRRKAEVKTQTATVKSAIRLRRHNLSKKTGAGGTMSRTQVRREGRLHRNLLSRLDEISGPRPIRKRK